MLLDMICIGFPLTLPSPPKGARVCFVVGPLPLRGRGYVSCSSIGYRWFYLLKLVINVISGMKSEITMKPTATPRKTMSRGSINFVKPSVMTRTSSS